MNHEQEANSIAKYALIQEAINNASALIVQVFGFSIAAMIVLILASLQTQTTYILFFIGLIIYFSISYVAVQTKSITETEAYIAVFIEPEIQSFQWKQIIFEKHQQSKEPKKKYLFRSPLNSSDFAAFAYASILVSLILLLVSNKKFMKGLATDWTNISLLVFLIGFIFLVLQSTEYNKENYYMRCKEDFEKRKERLLRLKPCQAKLVNSNGKEILIPESAYPVLHQVIQLMGSGQAVSVSAKKDKVSLQEAADILNVSRSFLMKLLEERKIPFTKVGSYQYIRFEDLITYKQQRDIQWQEGLTELTQFLQEEGFYGDEAVKFDS